MYRHDLFIIHRWFDEKILNEKKTTPTICVLSSGTKQLDRVYGNKSVYVTVINSAGF